MREFGASLDMPFLSTLFQPPINKVDKRIDRSAFRSGHERETKTFLGEVGTRDEDEQDETGGFCICQERGCLFCFRKSFKSDTLSHGPSQSQTSDETPHNLESFVGDIGIVLTPRQEITTKSCTRGRVQSRQDAMEQCRIP